MRQLLNIIRQLKRFQLFGSFFLLGLLARQSSMAQSPSWEWVADGRLTNGNIAGGITTCGIGVDKVGNVFFGGLVGDSCTVGSTSLGSKGGTDIFLAKTNASGAIQWAKTYGTVNADQIIDMVTDTAGNLYAQVWFGSPSFNLDGHVVTSLIFGVAIAKFDANGMCTIAKTTQSIAMSTGGLAYSPLGVLAAVNSSTVAKLSMNCDTLWTRTIPTSGSAACVFYDVTIDKDGNIIACGTLGGNANFGGVALTTPSIADLDDFVVKYNSAGVVQWAKQFGSRGPNDEYAYSVAADLGGHLYVFGNYRSKIGIEADTLTNAIAFPTIYMVKYSPTGTYEWSLNGTSTNQNFGRKVVCDPSNNIWVAFNPGGTVNFAGQDHIPSTFSGTMLVSIDTAGTFRSRLKTEGLGLSDPKSLVFNTAGTALYVGGWHVASNPTVVTFGSTTLNTSGCYIAKGSPGVPTGVDDDLQVPTQFSLEQNYPNPFNPTTTIAFSLSKRENVRIELFNIAGQKVRTLLDETRSAGEHLVQWNGKDDAGRLVATGTYLYRLTTDDRVQTKKMLLIK